MKVSSFSLLLLLSLCCMRIYAVQLVSVYPQRPDDREAFYFTPENYGIRADGRTDVSDALQSAINQVKKEKNFGILFIPEGKYRSKTIIPHYFDLSRCSSLLEARPGLPFYTSDESITPAWHYNKRYWNDLLVTALPESIVKREIRHSYFTVIRKNVTPKALREKVLAIVSEQGLEDDAIIPE